MKDEAPFSDFPAYAEKSSNKKPLAIFLVIVAIIAAGVGGLYLLGRSRQEASQVKVIPTVEPSPTQAITSIPTASVSGTITPTGKITVTPTGTSSKIERSDLSIQVLNGSGVVGAGKKTSDYLKGLGYVISSTGNADAFDYKGITVKVKKANSDYGALLKKDLASFASGSAVVVSTDDAITTDAAVIVGK